jgi:hypothetical protein
LVWSRWNFWVYFGFFVAGFYELSKVHDVQPGPPGSVSCTKFCDGFVRTGSTTSQALEFLEEPRARRDGARGRACGRCDGITFEYVLKYQAFFNVYFILNKRLKVFFNIILYDIVHIFSNKVLNQLHVKLSIGCMHYQNLVIGCMHYQNLSGVIITSFAMIFSLNM